jgi:hypothetical protein
MNMCSVGEGDIESYGSKKRMAKSAFKCDDCGESVTPGTEVERVWWHHPDNQEIRAGFRCNRCMLASKAYQEHREGFTWMPGALVERIEECIEEEPESAEWIAPFFPEIAAKGTP